ncbi:MAG: hypothetical protein WBB37_10350 [bacterium]
MINIILILFLNQAFERYSGSAQTAALAQASTASVLYVDAIRFNPAALAIIQKNQLAAGYEYVLSGVEGLHNVNIGFARPFFNGGLGLQMSEFGFSEQKEQALTLAYGLNLSKDFMFGMSSDLYFISNERTGTAFSYGINFGLLGTVYKKWSLGAYVHNLNQPSFSTAEDSKLPYELRAGLAYRPFDDILSEIDVSMCEDEYRIHSAGAFVIFNMLALRFGIKTNPTVVSTGTGILHKFIEIDYAVEYVPDLPLTHNVSTKFTF